jgi:hypothetical protein
MVPAENRHRNSPAFDPNGSEITVGYPVTILSGSLQGRMKCTRQIVGAAPHGQTIRIQQLAFRVAVAELDVVMDCGGIIQSLRQALREKVLGARGPKLFLESRAMAPGNSIKDSCHKRRWLEQRLLCGLGHFLLLCPDVTLEPIVEIRKEELHWYSQDDAEAEGVD